MSDLSQSAAGRRAFLSRAGRGASLALGSGALALPGLALADRAGDRRFVLILLRGALDGLHALVPHGDPAYAGARRDLALSLGGESLIGSAAAQAAAAAPVAPVSSAAPAAAAAPVPAAAAPRPLHRLDDLFALHGELGFLAGLHARGEAIALHAVAGPYRERSHFDAQNILETGALAAYALRDGWLNRALSGRGGPPLPALALSQAVPTVLQGAVAVASYAPSRLPAPPEDTFARIARLYQGDEQLRLLWSQALGARGMAQEAGMASGATRPGTQFAETAATAARFLAQPQGPRIAVLESDGWDTHAQQAGRLSGLLRQLDRALESLALGLGAAWSQTAVLVVTEFGRTVSPNGTGGTDHGTGGAAFLAGGAVAGGRVLADWPGLAPAQLHQGRDLRPTLDLRALLKGVLHDHLQVPARELDQRVFPDSLSVVRLQGLFRA
jgi:uncharacterized protein (DUF1501 family)